MSTTSPIRSSGLAYIDKLAADGRSCFTTKDAHIALGGDIKATQAILRRLARRHEIATPVRGFHVILPPEYRAAGCRPAIQFIDYLATYFEFPYYVALLSAAEMHGAAHQRPQVTQVMVPRPRRPVRCGSTHIDFLVRDNAVSMATMARNTPTGIVRVATTEVTAVDLVGYADRCGGLGNVATVLRELAEDLSVEGLRAALADSPTAWAQRLGYLLGQVEADSAAAAVSEALTTPHWTLLDPRGPREGARDTRWQIVVNTVVEADQ